MEKEKTIEQTDKKPQLTKDGLKKAMSLFSYVLPYKWAFIAGMILLSTGSLIFLAIMKIPGEILNIISGSGVSSSINPASLAYTLFIARIVKLSSALDLGWILFWN